MWLPEDRDWAIAWQAERHTKCSGCGQPTDETMAHGVPLDAYRVRSMVCQACAEMEHHLHELGEAKDPPRGMKHWVEPNH